jgi:hypothetical protein
MPRAFGFIDSFVHIPHMSDDIVAVQELLIADFALVVALARVGLHVSSKLCLRVETILTNLQERTSIMRNEINFTGERSNIYTYTAFFRFVVLMTQQMHFQHRVCSKRSTACIANEL